MLAQVNYKFQFYALLLIDSSHFSCNSLKFTAHAYLIHAALLIPTISREQKYIWIISPWHLLLCRAEERDEEGEKKKETASGRVILAYVNRNKVGATVRGIMRMS
jgi:hypothetical protein